MSGPSAYLDHAAASPLDPRVRAAMLPFLAEEFGSPASLHEWGRRPAEALERARARVAALVGLDPEWIIFTSGATEARNLAVAGLLAGNRALGRRVTATALEHPATLAACRSATREAGGIDVVPVDGLGRVDPAALGAAVGEETAVVAVVHGQPDIGTLQDLPPLVAAARAARPEARIVIDAGETAGLVPLDAGALGADAYVVGGGPVGGPAWTGALAVRPGARLHPIIVGGVQEAGKRAGAEDLPGIVALGAAAEIAAAEMDGAGGADAGPDRPAARRPARRPRRAPERPPRRTGSPATSRSRPAGSRARASASPSPRAASPSPPGRRARPTAARPRRRSRRSAWSRPGPTRRSCSRCARPPPRMRWTAPWPSSPRRSRRCAP